jgi:hypothetical protein
MLKKFQIWLELLNNKPSSWCVMPNIVEESKINNFILSEHQYSRSVSPVKSDFDINYRGYKLFLIWLMAIGGSWVFFIVILFGLCNFIID